MSRKRLLSIIIALGCTIIAQATDIGFLVNIESSDFTDHNTCRMLKSRLERAALESGIPVADDNALFLTASIIPVSDEIIEGGMKKIYQTTYELSLTVENPILGIQFGTHTITIKGYGATETKALSNAITNLSPSGSSLSNFLTSTTKKADVYYADHFDEILSKARTISASGAYDEAIALLWGLPANGTESKILYSEIEKIYNKMQTSECGYLINNARNALAVKNYHEASEWLCSVDANSPCYSEAKLLSDKITKAYAADQKLALQREDAERARQAKILENDKRRKHELQTSVINSISSIATAYLNSRQSSVFYLW